MNANDAHAPLKHWTIWRSRGTCNRRRIFDCLASRETNPVERQADDEIDCREDYERAAPAIGLIQIMAYHPEDRRGISAIKSKVRDGLAAARRRHLHQGSERGVIKTEPHADAEHGPDGEIARHIVHLRKCKQPCRNDDRTDRHHGPRTNPIDKPADPRRNETHDEERYAKAKKYRSHGPSGLGDDRLRQDAEAVIARAPSRNLRQSERIHGDDHWVNPPSLMVLIASLLFLHPGPPSLSLVTIALEFARPDQPERDEGKDHQQLHGEERYPPADL
jgi:hypothetical protein